jgi:uncharacterized protein (DUF4213/DUF364 family)
LSIFESLRLNAINALKENSYKTEALGMTISCAYCSLTLNNKLGVGLALSPQGEGALSPIESNPLSILEKAKVYEPFSRAAALSVMNAIYAHKRTSLSVDYAPDMRVMLTQKVLKATDKDSRIVIIGNLKPVVAKLRENERNIEVFCRSSNNPSEKIYNDIFEYEAAMDADVLIITGAALLGSTVDALVAMSPKASLRILTGFSAGVDPQWLKGTGITHVCSVNLNPSVINNLALNNFESIFDYESYLIAVDQG